MSNHAAPRPGLGGGFARRAWVGALLLAVVFPPRARAEEDPIDAYARWVSTQGRWAGPTVGFPDVVPRPVQSGWVLDSDSWPLRVHAPAAAGYERAHAALVALERGYAYLVETGWPVPWPDGGRGGSAGFDLYLVAGEAEPSRVEVDVPVSWVGLDAATSWGAIDASVAQDALDACALATLTEAALLGQDPAEAAVWRRATGAFVAYLATGDFGCDDDAVGARQRASRAGWNEAPSERGAGAALLLAILASREGGDDGSFVRELWQFVRQRSEGRVLRASPDFGEALARALSNAGEALAQILEDVGIARYFAGGAARRAGAVYPVLRELGSDAEVPVIDLAFDALPEHVALDPPLRRGGSAYVRVAVPPAVVDARLPVWLRGDAGVRWSLTVVRLGADGRETGRVVAPPRSVPRSYIPLVLEPDTRAVLIVVTALAEKPRDLLLESDAESYATLVVGETSP